MGLGLAFKVFWRALTDRAFAQRVEPLLIGEAPSAVPAPLPAPAPLAAAVAPARSEALTLLAVLQREGRLLDFLKEPIAGYSDAQVGGAVRDIHRDCGAALDRIFAIRPVLDQADGSAVEVPTGFDAGRYQLAGNVAGQPPYRGKLRHGGWEATRVQLPQWNGTAAAANVVAPAEVEL
jgi:Domain of unknown function (DUF2760)